MRERCSVIAEPIYRGTFPHREIWNLGLTLLAGADLKGAIAAVENSLVPAAQSEMAVAVSALLIDTKRRGESVEDEDLRIDRLVQVVLAPFPADIVLHVLSTWYLRQEKGGDGLPVGHWTPSSALLHQECEKLTAPRRMALERLRQATSPRSES